jgi:hypothetical protein
MKFLLVTGQGAFEAELHASMLPLRWGPGQVLGGLLKQGLYAQRGGGLVQITRTLQLDDACVYAVWDDPGQTFHTADGRAVRPGTHVAALVRAGGSDTPPWVPVILPLAVSAEELDRGLLSAWIDAVALPVGRIDLTLERGGPLASTRGMAERTALEPLLETLAWLAAHPAESDGAAAAICRRMLVENAHGLQRLGVALMHADDAVRQDALTRVLRPLAPWLATLLEATAGTFTEGPQHADALTQALAPLLVPEHPVHTSEWLGVAACWLVGFFGARPERSLRQPARALYQAARALRANTRDPQVLALPDIQRPEIPLGTVGARALLRHLSWRHREASPLEALLRALALSEAGSEIMAVRREHLAAFAQLAERLRRSPVALRTLTGRYDWLLSMWSFRGVEVRAARAALENLEQDLVLEGPSVAAVRAAARVLGTRTACATALSTALAHADHPVWQKVARLTESDDAALVGQWERLHQQRKPARDLVHEALATAEFLVSAMEAGRSVEGFALPAPELPGDQVPPVRSHYLYWRQFCRSTRPEWAGVYGPCLESWLGEGWDALPSKVRTEVLALALAWIRMAPEHRDQARTLGWSQVALGVWTAGLAAPDDAEEQRVLCSRLAAELDPEAWLGWWEAHLDTPGLGREEVSRWLFAGRQAGLREALVAHPVFRRLHRRIAEWEGAAGTLARAEWLRAALEKSVRGMAWDRLLDARHDLRWLETAGARDFFARRAIDATSHPEDVWADLLEQGLGWVSEAQVESWLSLLQRNTRWPAREVGRLLHQHGRWAVLLAWLRGHALHEPTWALEAIDGLLGRHSDLAHLRHAAAGLELLQRQGTPEANLEPRRAGLLEALRGWAPHRANAHALPQLQVAWQQAGLPMDDPGLSAILVRALQQGVPHREEPVAGFASWFAEHTLAAALRTWTPPDGEPETTIDPAVHRALGKALEQSPAQKAGPGGGRRRSEPLTVDRALVRAEFHGPLFAQAVAWGMGTSSDDLDAAMAATDSALRMPLSDDEDAVHARLRRRVWSAWQQGLRWARQARAALDDSPIAPTAASHVRPGLWSLRHEVLVPLQEQARGWNVACEDPLNLLGSVDLDGEEVEVDSGDLEALVMLLTQWMEQEGMLQRWVITRHGLLLEATARAASPGVAEDSGTDGVPAPEPSEEEANAGMATDEGDTDETRDEESPEAEPAAEVETGDGDAAEAEEEPAASAGEAPRAGRDSGAASAKPARRLRALAEWIGRGGDPLPSGWGAAAAFRLRELVQRNRSVQVVFDEERLQRKGRGGRIQGLLVRLRSRSRSQAGS